MQFMQHDMGTQMALQKIKAKHGGSMREAIAEVNEVFEEKDERFEKMGRFFREERDLLVRQELSKL